jgi:hypothetical protein
MGRKKLGGMPEKSLENGEKPFGIKKEAHSENNLKFSAFMKTTKKKTGT